MCDEITNPFPKVKFVNGRVAYDYLSMLRYAVSVKRGPCKNFGRNVQYIPRNMHTVFALLCFVVVIHWLIFPYPSGLLRWHCGNLTIAPVPAKQPWWIWINTSCEFIMNDSITTTKQSTTKPCVYFLGYTVSKFGSHSQHSAGWLPGNEQQWIQACASYTYVICVGNDFVIMFKKSASYYTFTIYLSLNKVVLARPPSHYSVGVFLFDLYIR